MNCFIRLNYLRSKLFKNFPGQFHMIHVIQTGNQWPGQHLMMQRKLYTQLLGHWKVCTVQRGGGAGHSSAGWNLSTPKGGTWDRLPSSQGDPSDPSLPTLVMLVKTHNWATEVFKETCKWERHEWGKGDSHARGHECRSLLQEALLRHFMRSHLTVFSQLGIFISY